jgi:hypothetical protein
MPFSCLHPDYRYVDVFDVVAWSRSQIATPDSVEPFALAAWLGHPAQENAVTVVSNIRWRVGVCLYTKMRFAGTFC